MLVCAIMYVCMYVCMYVMIVFNVQNIVCPSKSTVYFLSLQFCFFFRCYKFSFLSVICEERANF